MRGYFPPSSDAERLFVKRIADLAKQVYQRGVPRFTMFCSDREQALAPAALAHTGAQGVFWGGYDGAERKMLCVCVEEVPVADFPFEALQISPKRDAAALSHRDYLGALMALGIKREWIGDIVTNGTGAVVFVANTMTQHVLDSLLEVGRSAVAVSKAQELCVEAPQCTAEPRTATVSSLRLDAVLAAMMKTSRGNAAALIKSGAVQVNHVETGSVHYEVFENDVFTVRGYGKYRLCNVGSKSKKDRTFVSYVQY